MMGKERSRVNQLLRLVKRKGIGEDFTIGLKSSDEGRIIAEKKIEKKRLWKDLVDDILDDL